MAAIRPSHRARSASSASSSATTRSSISPRSRRSSGSARRARTALRDRVDQVEGPELRLLPALEPARDLGSSSLSASSITAVGASQVDEAASAVHVSEAALGEDDLVADSDCVDMAARPRYSSAVRGSRKAPESGGAEDETAVPAGVPARSGADAASGDAEAEAAGGRAGLRGADVA